METQEMPRLRLMPSPFPQHLPGCESLADPLHRLRSLCANLPGASVIWGARCSAPRRGRAGIMKHFDTEESTATAALGGCFLPEQSPRCIAK